MFLNVMCTKLKIFYILIIFLISFPLFCAEKKEEAPPRIGNFSLPGAQQPNQLIGFGGNIVDKGMTQAFIFESDYIFQKGHSLTIQPGILYGVTDNFSIFPNLPVLDLKQDKSHSNGLGDAFIALEYAFYSPKTIQYEDQYTVLTQIFFPTGSKDKDPPTGNGSMCFLLGGTYSRTMVDWFYFTADGMQITTAKNGTKFGNTYIYDVGFGRNICYSNQKNCKFIFAWIIEIYGQYSTRDRINGVTNPDSGGNFTFLVPSLWYSTEKLILQFGIGPILTQNLFGVQLKYKYTIQANIGYTF